jgi:hypothetical protein
MQIENWSRETRAETEDVPFIWNHTESDYKTILVKDESGEYADGTLYYSEMYRSEESRANGDDPKEVIAEGTDRRAVKKATTDWLAEHPYGGSDHIRRKCENLSDSGKEYLENYGYHEIHVPFVWEDDEEEGSPPMLTIGVVDEDVPVEEDYDYEDFIHYRQEWASENLRRLIRERKILYVSGDEISSLSQLRAYKDDIITIMR